LERGVEMKIVENSRGKAPAFTVTFGLQEGYGDSSKIHTVDEVVTLIESFLKKCAAAGRSFLTGSVTAGTVVYAWPEGEGKAGGGHEPQASFIGNQNPLYNSNMSQAEIEDFLNDLAAEVGVALGQTRVYISFAGDLWILQQEEAATPTGE